MYFANIIDKNTGEIISREKGTNFTKVEILAIRAKRLYGMPCVAYIYQSNKRVPPKLIKEI